MSQSGRLNLRVVRDEEIATWARLTATALEGMDQNDETRYASALAEEPPDSRELSYLAWYGEQPVARLRLSVAGDRAAVWGIGLTSQARSHGLEAMLLQAVEDLARSKAAGRLTAEVDPERVAWFTKAGYRFIKSRFFMRARLRRRKIICGCTLRHPRPDDRRDVEALGELLYAAYLNTIDYDGEGVEDGHAEVARCLAGQYGRFLARCSYVLEVLARPAGAVLLTEQERGVALLAEVVIRPEYRGQGHARPMIQAAMNACLDRSWNSMVLMVTRGNNPAEGLYRRMGFREEPGGEICALQKVL